MRPRCARDAPEIRPRCARDAPEMRPRCARDAHAAITPMSGKSIAKALGRDFQRVSLGGVHSEAEVRGHRRTYVGALPGLIMQAVKKCGSDNCVIMLDEVDKLGRNSYNGDPASALLEVRDPATCHTPRVTRHVSHATCHTPRVTRHVSPATRHVSHATCHTPRVTRHVSHAMFHTPRVTRHPPRVTRHPPPATCHTHARPRGRCSTPSRTPRSATTSSTCHSTCPRCCERHLPY